MNVTLLCILYIILPICSYAAIQSKGWQFLTPLHSTRTDIEKISGIKSDGFIGVYDFPDATVTCVYSVGSCREGWKTAKDTILNFTVSFKNTPKLSDFALDLNQYTKIRDLHLADVVYYENKQKGIIYEVLENEVRKIIYTPTESDERLKCKVRKTLPKKNKRK